MSAVLVSVAACLPGGGDDLAAEIRAADSPIVEDITVSHYNKLVGNDYDHVTVYVRGDATEEELKSLWCDVVMPANPSRLGKGEIWFDVGAVHTPEYVEGGKLIPQDRQPTCP